MESLSRASSGLGRIRQLLSPPIFPDDEEKTRVAYRLNAVALASLLSTLVYSLVWVIVLPQFLGRLPLAIILMLMFATIIMCIRSGRVEIARSLFLSGLWIVVTLASASSGGTRAPIYGVYALVIVSATILDGWNATIFYAAVTFVASLVMTHLSSIGLIKDPFATPLSSLMSQTYFMVVIIVPIYIIIRDLERALARIRQELTRREKIEADLRVSEFRLRALLDATIDVAFLLSHDGTLLTFNKTLAESRNATANELVGRNEFEMLSPEIRPQRYERFETILQTRQPMRWVDQAPNGWWDNSVYPVLSPSGEVEALAVYSRNITDQKRLEAELQAYTSQLENMVNERTNALRRANEQLELVLNHTVNALAFAEPSGDIVVTNPAFHTIFSEGSAKSMESILWSLTSEKHMAAVSVALLKAIYDREIQHVEAQFSSGDGRERDVDLSFIPVRMTSADGRNGVLLSGHDITQLKEIERFKARFVGNAVHDLATPISGISTRLYMLQRNPERMVEHVRALENQTLHLRNLLDDLRTLSQIDYGHDTLTLEVCNLNELVQQVYDIFEPVALEKQQSLILSIDSALPPVHVDRRQIERVLVNLVSNAINYTSEYKEIRIETTSAEQAVMVAVIDQGIGISATDLPHVFERFYRTDEARQSRSGGTGLGLAISKETVEIHGGAITVTSEPGQGSTFTVCLPRKR